MDETGSPNHSEISGRIRISGLARQPCTGQAWILADESPDRLNIDLADDLPAVRAHVLSNSSSNSGLETYADIGATD